MSTIVAVLIERGAALNWKDSRGRTPTDLAARPGAPRAIRRLLADAHARLAARPDVKAITEIVEGYLKAFAAGDRPAVERRSLAGHAERLPAELTPLGIEWLIQDVGFETDDGWAKVRITAKESQPPYQFRFDLRRTRFRTA